MKGKNIAISSSVSEVLGFVSCEMRYSVLNVFLNSLFNDFRVILYVNLKEYNAFTYACVSCV